MNTLLYLIYLLISLSILKQPIDIYFTLNPSVCISNKKSFLYNRNVVVVSIKMNNYLTLSNTTSEFKFLQMSQNCLLWLVYLIWNSSQSHVLPLGVIFWVSFKLGLNRPSCGRDRLQKPGQAPMLASGVPGQVPGESSRVPL